MNAIFKSMRKIFINRLPSAYASLINISMLPLRSPLASVLAGQPDALNLEQAKQ